jgi:hypothetical protein
LGGGGLIINRGHLRCCAAPECHGEGGSIKGGELGPAGMLGGWEHRHKPKLRGMAPRDGASG